MLLNLMVIFNFQIFYGYLYHQIGLLIASFMAGMAVGSLFTSRRLEKGGRGKMVLYAWEFCLISYTVLLPLIFFLGKRWFFEVSPSPFYLFPLLSFLAGLPVGGEFSAANHLYGRRRIGESAGLLYASDLLGGWLGGVIGGVIILPLMGILGGGAILSSLKILSISLLLKTIKDQTYSHK